MRQSNDGMLGAMPVPRLVVTMSLPIMLSMLISAVYNLVDSVYVAQYSDEAFLALSYAYPIQMLLVAFCSGIGVGFSAIFSRRLGEGDQEQAASAVCHGFFTRFLRGSFSLLRCSGFFFLTPQFFARKRFVRLQRHRG